MNSDIFVDEVTGIQIELIHPNAIFSCETSGSSGYDVCNVSEAFVGAKPVVIPTGIKLIMPVWEKSNKDVPYMFEAQIRPRSSGPLKLGIHVQFGTVDQDYEGELSAIAWSVIGPQVKIPVGTRIAQIVFSPVIPIEVNRKDVVRGERGFGSTGTS